MKTLFLAAVLAFAPAAACAQEAPAPPAAATTPAAARLPDADPATWVTTDAVAAVIHFLTAPASAAVNGTAVRVPGPSL